MLGILPTETILETLSYLPVETLRELLLVSRDWHIFITTNESTIYKKAALLHRYLPSSNATSVSDLRSIYAERSLFGVASWKDLCRKRYLIEKAWLGRGISKVKRYTSTGKTVHRIKVDEHAGIIITTSRQGGLFVTDLADNQLLWSLPQEYVRSRAHCEYGNGFLIFDRWDGAKEVWRRTCEFDPAQHPTSSPPDVFQSLTSGFASRASPLSHGHFRVWALLRMPELTRAYRFVYPTLVVATRNSAYIWDIPSATLIQTIHETRLDGQISYVELSARHVFICGTEVLRIFSRVDGTNVLDIPSTRDLYADWKFYPNASVSQPTHAPGILVQYPLHRQHDVEHISHPRLDQFVAVHVSSCGSHLVALLRRSRLLVLYNFERVIRREIELSDAMVDIQLGPPYYSSRYLAFENDKVTVATGYGIFVLSIETAPDLLDVAADPQPIPPPSRAMPGRVSICLASRFNDHPLLRRITCLQMADTGLFFNWSPSDPLLSDSIQENYFHSMMASVQAFNGVPPDDGDLIDEDIDVDPERDSSTVFCIDFLPAEPESQSI